MKTLTESQDLAAPAADARAGPSSAPADERLGQRVGHFRLVSVLGRGGMGVVYLAEDLTLRRRVALKVLPAVVAADPERRGRFLREARAASAVAHPSVAAVFEVGEDGADLFLVMEHVAGQTLHDRIAERGALDLGEARRIGAAIAAGMAAAHEAGVIHRDLKPANVMIAEGEATKILDFGIARSLAPPDDGPLEAALTVPAGATAEGRILGTPGYMAPEQIHGRPVDGRADVFSFGVLLYEMITGARPFAGDTSIERLVAVDRDTPRPPSARRPGVPATLDSLVLRCLEKRPEDRFGSFREVLAALEAREIPAPRGRRVALAALGLGLGAIGVALVVAIAPWRATTTAVPSAPTASASTLVAASADPLPIRRPCLDDELHDSDCKGSDIVAWCNLGGRVVGCCGKGLVPIGTDGICACAPGGTTVPEALARGCPASPPASLGTYNEARDRAANLAIECFRPGLDAGWSRGGEFAVSFSLTPEGRVFGARLERSTIPEVAAQTCALEALRSTRFPPPRGEDAGKRQSWGLEFSK
jgi:hypothetical protein